MHPNEYAKMYEQERSYWWFQGRMHLIISLLKQLENSGRVKKESHVVDLGCGTGLMLEHLVGRYDSFGLDFSHLSMQYCRRRGLNRLVQASVEDIPIADKQMDLAVALDLAEHVADDMRFFREIRRVLKADGTLIMSVPAHPCLWSDHDEALYHQRRYTKRDLKNKIESSGLKIERLSYCISATFPLIVGFRLLQNTLLRFIKKPNQPKTHLIMLPGFLNSILRWSIQIEALLLRYINLPFGVTLLIVAQPEE